VCISYQGCFSVAAAPDAALSVIPVVRMRNLHWSDAAGLPAVPASTSPVLDPSSSTLPADVEHRIQRLLSLYSSCADRGAHDADESMHDWLQKQGILLIDLYCTFGLTACCSAIR